MSDTAPQPLPPRPPPKRSGSETRKRSRLVVFRATDEECAEVEAAAEQAGLTLGSYIRTRLLTAPTTRTVRRPPVERALLAQLLGQLGRVGGNMHQILRHLNFGGSVTRGELEAALAEFRDAASAILQAMGKRPSVGGQGTRHDH